MKKGALRLAIFATTLVGNGTTSASAPSASTSSFANIKTSVPTVRTEPTDSIGQIDLSEQICEQLIDGKKNIAGNFDLKGRTFTADELAEIGQCELSEQIQKTAQKTSKRGLPKKGQQTYCLSAVKSFFAQNGITIDAQRFAYRAVSGFQSNENFTEVEADMSNFRSLPDGAVIAWEKGTTRYGHIAMKIGNKEFCDFVYNLRTNNRRGSSGQRYGKPHIFILKDMTFSKELTQKLIAEGRLDKSLEKQAQALIKINDMKNLLSSIELTSITKNLSQKDLPTADKITLKNSEKREGDSLQLPIEILNKKRQRN